MGRKVVEFRLAPDDISAIRFGFSPGHELSHAVRVLANPQLHPLQWGWLRMTRPLVPERAFTLLRLVVGDEGYMPDFLTSNPSWDLTPEEELTRLRGAELGPMRVDLGKRASRTEGSARGMLLDMQARPERARADIASAFEEMWDATIGMFWSTIERMLRADIGARSRRVSSHGIAEMIDSIDPAVTWSPNAVRVELAKHAEVLDCRGSGLVLVPSVMSRRCAALTELPAQPTLFYPALGVTELWTQTTETADKALTDLLGNGRSRVLRCLQAPLSTTEAAAATSLAISTASHHLSTLRAAGLIDSRRMGSTMLHARTPLGDALVIGVGAA